MSDPMNVNGCIPKQEGQHGVGKELFWEMRNHRFEGGHVKE